MNVLTILSIIGAVFAGIRLVLGACGGGGNAKTYYSDGTGAKTFLFDMQRNMSDDAEVVCVFNGCHTRQIIITKVTLRSSEGSLMQCLDGGPNTFFYKMKFSGNRERYFHSQILGNWHEQPYTISWKA